MPNKRLGSVAQGLQEAAQAVSPGPTQTRLNNAAELLEEVALHFSAIERMARAGDPGIPEICDRALQQLGVRS